MYLHRVHPTLALGNVDVASVECFGIGRTRLATLLAFRVIGVLGQFGMHCEMSVLTVPRLQELVGHCWQPAVASLEYVLALHFRLLSEPCGAEGLRDMTDSPIHPSKLEMSLFFSFSNRCLPGSH
jgi:hypothetical protein